MSITRNRPATFVSWLTSWQRTFYARLKKIYNYL